MKLPLIVILALQFASPATFAADGGYKRDELRISRVINRVSTAWQVGDRTSWAAGFVEDAYFTVLFESGPNSKERLAWNHQLIFDNFHTDTEFNISVRQIRFVKADVAIVQLSGFVTSANQATAAEAHLIPTAIVERKGQHWKVVAFQNTPFVVDEYRAYGNLRRFKPISTASAGGSE